MTNFVWCLLQRFCGRVYTAIWNILRRLGRGEPFARVMPLPFGLYLKRAYPQEALATEYVRQHTSIPVPRVLDVVPCYDRFYVLMTKVPGEELGMRAPRVSNLSPRQLQVLQDTLRDRFDQRSSRTSRPARGAWLRWRQHHKPSSKPSWSRGTLHIREGI